VFSTRGFAPLREDWLAHAARLGQPIRARTGAATREGIFETIDATGALVLHMPTATLAIPAAEVFF
jgi:BirA family biotin operon repressor/biotin-[acetyl-CoA-carboxylase] ligase